MTLNVKTLYTNMLNNERIKAVREAYDKHPSKTVSTKVIIIFLSLILTSNDFIFNCSHYLQIMGCAIGTICANISMPALIFLWHNLKEKDYTFTFMAKFYCF